jgi:hypothetical protein
VVEVQGGADSSGGAGGGVARYLRPEAEVVRFWPRPELEELTGWVAVRERVAARLVTGAGGAGKTRLARQLGERVAEPGWQSWWVPAGLEADAVRAAREGDVPVQLIADYAETRTALPFMLAAAVWAGELPGWLGLPGRVRLRAGAAAGYSFGACSLSIARCWLPARERSR